MGCAKKNIDWQAIRRTQGGVFSVAVSPDDRKVASGGEDATIIIWDVENGQMIFDPLVKHTGGVNSVCFSPDGKRLASGSDDFTVIVSNAETGATILTLKGHRKYVLSVAFSPDGQKLASGSSDRRVRVWRVDSDDEDLLLFEINAHQNWVRSVVWSPDGNQLVSASDDKTVKFWNASNDHGGLIGICTGHTAQIYSLAISSDGSFIVTGAKDKTIVFWSTKTFKKVDQPLEHTDPILCLAISPDGALLASGSPDPEVRLWPVGDVFRRHSEPADLTASIISDEEYPASCGGFGEIWKCIYKTDRGPINVAVKLLRTFTADTEDEMAKKAERLERELKTCARLQHSNILPLYGYMRHERSRYKALVFPWAEKGNLTSYLKNEATSITAIKRFQILKDIATGMHYLHDNKVIHGDLNGRNVLIRNGGTACLADFGLSLIYSEVTSVSVAPWTSGFYGNSPWMAPELFEVRKDGSPTRPSEESDIYSFGGIMLHVLTNKIPYHYLCNNVITSRRNEANPSRSEYPPISDKYWDFIEKCWSAGAQDRPSAKDVVKVIEDEFNLLSNS